MHLYSKIKRPRSLWKQSLLPIWRLSVHLHFVFLNHRRHIEHNLQHLSKISVDGLAQKTGCASRCKHNYNISDAFPRRVFVGWFRQSAAIEFLQRGKAHRHHQRNEKNVLHQIHSISKQTLSYYRYREHNPPLFRNDVK